MDDAALVEYTARRKRALCELVSAVYDDQMGYIAFSIHTTVSVDGNWLVAEGTTGRWQIAVLPVHDGEWQWRKYMRPRVDYEQVEDWEPGALPAGDAEEVAATQEP